MANFEPAEAMVLKTPKLMKATIGNGEELLLCIRVRLYYSSILMRHQPRMLPCLMCLSLNHFQDFLVCPSLWS